MHYRFLKRFLFSAVIFILCGFLLISRWSKNGLRIKAVGMIEQHGLKSFDKVKRLVSTSVDQRKQTPTSNLDDANDDDIKDSASTGWIKKVLNKNLTREEAVDQLLKEIDNHLPHAEIATSKETIVADEVQTNTIWEPHLVSTTSPANISTANLLHTKPVKKKRKKWKRPNIIFAGFMNVHIWQAWCGSTVEDLRRHKHFPLYPDMRTTTENLFVKHREQSYGQRIFGFIHPPKSGNYTFYLSSDDNSELWLSNSSSPKHIRKIAWVGNSTNPENTPVAYFKISKTQTSKIMRLARGGIYYMEVVHKQNAFSDHVLVAWKGPTIRSAKLIESKYISAFMSEDELSSDVNVLADYIPETRASYPTHHHGSMNTNSLLLKNISDFGARDHRDDFHLTPFVDDLEVNDLLPKCEYNPSYLVDFEVNRYEGVYLIHETAVFPDDKTELTHMVKLVDCDIRNRDSHRNLLRPTPGKEYFDPSYYENDADVESESLPKIKKITDEQGTFRIGSSFDSLLHKLKRRFKDFNSYVSNNMRIFGSKSSDRGLQKSRKGGKFNAGNHIDNGKEAKSKGQRTERKGALKSDSRAGNRRMSEKRSKQTKYNSQNSRTKPVQAEVGAGNDLSRLKSIYNGKDNSKENENEKKGNKEEEQSDKSVVNAELRHNHFDDGDDDDDDDDNDEMLIGKEGFIRVRPLKDISMNAIDEDIMSENKQKIDTENSKKNSKWDVNNTNKHRIILPYDKKTSLTSKSKASKANSRNHYDATPKGRKLLAVEVENQFLPAYQTEDEGLPASWNKFKQKKPIFVPISGVENLNKPLPSVNAARRSLSVRNIFAKRRQETEEAAPFEMKSYYKKFNITSNRDAINKFKIFKYAFFDMTKEIPRLHGWKFHQDLTSCKSDGNLRLNEKVATSIVDRYMRVLRKRHGDKYILQKIVNVEENHDVINGDRYLVELDLKMKDQGDKSFRLSRYVYQKLGSLSLCEPNGFQWNRHATVHVIVPVKNQGRWVQHFIDNMEQIYIETLDQHLSIIIVDFNSTDIDIEKSLKNSKLKRYKLIKLSGPFQRALGIQAGADSVKNPHDIIFTCDLHLEIPSALIDNIRKHCVEGKMAFAPIVVRLNCGYLPENPYGLWELQGYGLFAICKSDFDKAGGMNTKEFKTKWGGEDWEMLDRILTNKVEVERLRIPKFYHYYHSKKGMWSRT